MSGSASFHNVRKSRYAARALAAVATPDVQVALDIES